MGSRNGWRHEPVDDAYLLDQAWEQGRARLAGMSAQFEVIAGGKVPEHCFEADVTGFLHQLLGSNSQS